MNKVLLLLLIALVATPLAASAKSANLQWDPSPDAAVAGYRIHYQPGSADLPFSDPAAASIDNGAVTFATVDGLDPANSYYFAVTAYNSAGAESAYSNVVNLPESLPPAVSITSPASGTDARGVISISASVSDNVGVTRVQFMANGQVIAETATAPYNCSWDTSAQAAGSYTLSARAYDAAGNEAVSANVVVKVAGDTEAPTPSVSGPAAGTAVSGTVALHAAAVDNVGVVRMELAIDGAVVLSTNQASVSYNWNTAAEANGSHAVTVRAYDAAGNVGLSAPLTVSVMNDLTPPLVAIVSPASGSVLSGRSAVAVSASDEAGVAKVEFLVNGVLQSTSTSAAPVFSWDTAALGNGSYTLSARAYDGAGNIGYSQEVAVSVFYDRSAPVITAFSLPAYHNSTTVPIERLAAWDDVAVTGYLVTENAAAPSLSATGWSETPPDSFTFSAAGSRTAYAWARDAAGNLSFAGSATVVVDTVLPVISNMSMVTGSSSVAINVSATDDVAVGRIELYLDRALVAQTTEAFLEYVWDVVLKRSQSVMVMVYDRAGNLRSRSLKVSKF